jgi:FkbM family methyltransferase
MVGTTGVLHLEDITAVLRSELTSHIRGSVRYEYLEGLLLERVSTLKTLGVDSVQAVIDDGVQVILEYVDFGQGGIDTFNLFGIDELIVFLLYSSREKPARALDIGANVGLHSVLMAKSGWTVDSYEPDPVHLQILHRHLEANGVVGSVNVFDDAVSDYDGEGSFTRVVGNSTGSHLTGSKENPYGELDFFNVSVKHIGRCISGHRFAKIDAEGAEARILSGIPRGQWDSFDVVLEVGSRANAESIFRMVGDHGLSAFSQKTGWEIVQDAQDIPRSYMEGSLFISGDSRSPWGK